MNCPDCLGVSPQLSKLNPGAESSEESRRIGTQKIVVKPKREEYDQHMITHIPYRSWCEFCVRGKAKNDAHASTSKESREVPMISCDYLVRSKANAESEGSMPVIVTIDHDTNWISAHMVEKKGMDAFAVNCLVREIEASGYSRLIIKSDQENAIKDVVSAARRERAEDIQVMTEES